MVVLTLIHVSKGGPYRSPERQDKTKSGWYVIGTMFFFNSSYLQERLGIIKSMVNKGISNVF